MEITDAIVRIKAQSEKYRDVSTCTDPSVCPICGGSGAIVGRRNGEVFARECECEIKRRTTKRIIKSGLAPLLENCRFDTYKTLDRWQKGAKEAAQNYLSDWRGKWFYIGGAVGCGKTHLCAALCGELMNAGKDLRFLQWRSDTQAIKASVNDEAAYKRIMDPLKTVKALYIDDFLKGSATEADRNLAFDLLNSRYNNPDTATIISSERTISEIIKWDEAIGSRIAERARGYTLNIHGAEKNWRLNLHD